VSNKIQILGPPRTGTTCLYDALRETTNYSTGIFEPINPFCNYKIPFLNFQEPLVQTHLNIIKNHPTTIIEKNVIIINNQLEINFQISSYLKFYKEYLKNFDKIIFLYRSNLEEQAISFKTAKLTNNWHTPYKASKIDYKDVLSYLQVQNYIVKTLSNFFNIPLTYYEDLYSNNLDFIYAFLDYYKIKVDNMYYFFNIMDNKNRLKQ
jgi:hypothetical protein